MLIYILAIVAIIVGMTIYPTIADIRRETKMLHDLAEITAIMESDWQL